MKPRTGKVKNAIRFLFTKRLTLSLFVILPLVFALTAFASGFIALIVAEHYLLGEGPTPDAVQKTMSAIRIEVLGFTLLGALAGLGVAYAIVNPIRKLIEDARRAASGDWGSPLELPALEELGAVGQDFRQALSSLKQNLIDSMAWGWVLLSKTGTIAALNPGAELILGVQGKDLVGQPFETLLASVQMEQDLVETVTRTLEGRPQPPQQTLDIMTQDGRRVRLSFTSTLLQDSNQNTLGMAVTFKDLTRSQEITEQMQRADKLAAMGTLAACLAHEIRNPLGAIRGLSQLLDEAFGEDDPQRAYTRMMIREIDRLNETVNSLLEFAHPDSAEAVPVSANDLVAQALTLARVEGGRGEIHLEKTLDPADPEVFGNRRKLVQALLNLILNATQAVEPGGRIRVATRRVAGPTPAEERVEISVANTGLPLNPSVKARMFDPFFTTKKDGTGLGLAIAQQIVHTHRGRLYAETRDGMTLFCMELPAAGVSRDRAPVAS